MLQNPNWPDGDTSQITTRLILAYLLPTSYLGTAQLSLEQLAWVLVSACQHLHNSHARFPAPNRICASASGASRSTCGASLSFSHHPEVMFLSSGFLLCFLGALLATPFLTWFITSNRFHQHISDSEHSRKKDDEWKPAPPVVPYRTPLIGDVISALRDPEGYVSGIL